MPRAKKCLKCGMPRKVYVIGTYINEKGSEVLDLKYRFYRRRYECANCGDRYTSYEIDQRDLKRLVHKAMNADRALDKMKAQLGVAKSEIEVSQRLTEKLKNNDGDTLVY